MRLEKTDCSLPRVQGPVDAVVRVPGSKSLANRALVLGALADGRTVLTGAPDARDVRAMMTALRALGVPVHHDPETRLTSIEGTAGRWPVDEAALDADDAGTVLRFLTAAVSVGEGRYWIDCGEQLCGRPIGGLVEALRGLGVKVEYEGREHCCPIAVEAHGLRGGTVSLDAPKSSQFISALLLAAPLARSDVFIETTGPLRSRPYIEMTVRMVDAFGAGIVSDSNGRWIIPGMQRYSGTSVEIEPDASNASYFMGLAALAGGRVTITGLRRESLQGDIQMLRLLESMGCRTTERKNGVEVAGPADGRLRGLDTDIGDCPDLAPALAVLAMFADGATRLRGVPHLRLKESDRIYSISQGLERLGARVEIREDGLTIYPASTPTAAIIDAFNDHRIAMAFTMASARLDGIVICGAGCVSKSYPEFFDEWRRATHTSTQ